MIGIGVRTRSSGHDAPAVIQLAKPSTTGSSNWPAGGISNDSNRNASRIKLSSALPGTIAGPESPPSSSASSDVSFRPPSCSVSPWHWMQCLISVGRTWISKRSRDAGDEAFATAVPRTIPAHPNRNESRCRREVGITCVCLEWSRREETLTTNNLFRHRLRVLTRVMALWWEACRLNTGRETSRLPLERWPTACLRVRSGSLAKTGGKQIDNAPLVYRVVTLSWGDRSNFSASFLSRRNGRNGGFAAIWLARISVKGAS